VFAGTAFRCSAFMTLNRCIRKTEKIKMPTTTNRNTFPDGTKPETLRTPATAGVRKLWRVLWIGLMVLGVFLVSGISLTIGWRPVVGPRARTLTTREFERTPQRLERGRYIFMGLSGCVHCHSPFDMSRRGLPPVAGMTGAGQVLIDEASPGRIVAPNLTPDVETGSGSWTDDQIARDGRFYSFGIKMSTDLCR